MRLSLTNPSFNAVFRQDRHGIEAADDHDPGLVYADRHFERIEG